MIDDADRVIDVYRRHGRAWASERGYALRERDWLDRFLAPLADRPTILDIGCGSGDPIARYLIGAGCRITGIDSSAELLTMCQEKFPEQQWLQADMRTLSLDQFFDGILAWDSFFHLSPDDQRKMFPIFGEHSAPGGTLMFTSGTSHGVAMGEYRGEALYHASLDPKEYRTLLRSNGFEVGAHVEEDPSCGGHTIWLSRRL